MRERIANKCLFCKADLENNEVCPECGLSQNERTLVDWEIKKLLDLEVIIVEPILNLEEQLGPTGLDLRLDGVFRELRHTRRGFIDLSSEIPEHEFYDTKILEIDKGQHYYIQPGKFVLGQTFEYVALPEFILGELDGRSSWSKSGLEVHATASKIAPGFKGHITFELKNSGEMPVKLQPLSRVACLTFRVTKRPQKTYKGKFQFQVKIKPPKPDDDVKRLDSYFKQNVG